MAITLQIIGHKKSGKTLITEALTKRLVQEKLDVCVLKHAHQAQMDVDGSDSARFSKAGAKQVILATPAGFFYHRQGQDPDLATLIKQLPSQPNIILAEGFKEAHYPKLLLLKENETIKDFSEVSNVIQVASINVDKDLPLNTPEKIISWAVNYLKQKVDQQ